MATVLMRWTLSLHQLIYEVGKRKSGNIGYIVDYQGLKWQHFRQQGGNNRQHFGGDESPNEWGTTDYADF
jgi:hypothetical protein